jgi:hypothetical protein
MGRVVKLAVLQSKRDVERAAIQHLDTADEFALEVIVKKFIAIIFHLVLYQLLMYRLMELGVLGVIGQNVLRLVVVDIVYDKENVMILLHSK